MYPDFCQAGKVVNKMLAKAGGIMMSPLTKADEAVDSAGTIAQWLKLMKTLVLPDSLESAIEARMGVANEPLRYQIKWQEDSSTRAKAEPFVWPEDKSSLCVINEELLVGGDITKRSTRRIGFEMTPGTSYITGDHLAVNPLNSMEKVYRFAACFESEFKKVASSRGKAFSTTKELIDWQLQQPFEVDCIDNGRVYPAQTSFEPSTLSENLQVGISLSISESSAGDLISAIKPYVPSKVAHADREAVELFNVLSDLILEGGKGSEHQDAMDSFLSLFPTVVDLLETLAPIAATANKPIPLADVLSILPRLQPRLYSISSSSVTSPSVVEISVGVVHAHTRDGVHIKGVCSNYLARLNAMHDRARVTIRTSSFRGPKDIVNTPMIMVGAGTGLAPMMGFLQVRYICMSLQLNSVLCTLLTIPHWCLLLPSQDRANALEDNQEENKPDGDVDCHLFFGCRSDDERIYREKD
jgi:sulfite reductase alpha subunit-like flavoprotein